MFLRWRDKLLEIEKWKFRIEGIIDGIILEKMELWIVYF